MAKKLRITLSSHHIVSFCTFKKMHEILQKSQLTLTLQIYLYFLNELEIMKLLADPFTI